MDDRAERSSRIAGFHELSGAERREALQRFAGLSDSEVRRLVSPEALPLARAERMIENVAGRYALPIGFAPNFRVDGRDAILPLVVEEPSVVAAASHAAKLLRGGDGIVTEATAPVVIGQIQILEVADMDAAQAALANAAPGLLADRPRAAAPTRASARLRLHPEALDRAS